MKEKLDMTPLQRVVGFEIAEEVYDTLPITAQLILDLMIEGYTQTDIGKCLGMNQSSVNDIIRRSRIQLLNSKLKMVLESRVHYKETHPIVLNGE